MYTNLPIVLNELLAEYIGGMKLWERIQAQWNLPDRDYTLTLKSDEMNWSDDDHETEQERWADHISWAFKVNVGILALMFDENLGDCEEVGHRFALWMSGNTNVDTRVAASCLKLLFNNFAKEVRSHYCYGGTYWSNLPQVFLCYELPSTMFCFGDVLQELMILGAGPGAILKRVVKEEMKTFRIEEI